jgi:hypothetical protein
MPTELNDGKKLEFDEDVYDIGPGKCTVVMCITWHRMHKHCELLRQVP